MVKRSMALAIAGFDCSASLLFTERPNGQVRRGWSYDFALMRRPSCFFSDRRCKLSHWWMSKEKDDGEGVSVMWSRGEQEMILRVSSNRGTGMISRHGHL